VRQSASPAGNKNGKSIVVNNPVKNAEFYARLDNATGFKTKTAMAVPLILKAKSMA